VSPKKPGQDTGFQAGPGRQNTTQEPSSSGQPQSSAAQHASAKEQHAPFIGLPRVVAPPSEPIRAPSTPIQPAPQPSCVFPLAQESAQSAQSDPAVFPHVLARQEHAPLINSTRHVTLPSIPNFATHISPPPPPSSIHAFPHFPEPCPSALPHCVSVTQALAEKQFAPLVEDPREFPPNDTQPVAPSAPRHDKPPPLHAFPHPSQPPPLAQSSPGTAQHVSARLQSASPVNNPRHVTPPPASSLPPFEPLRPPPHSAYSFPFAQQPTLLPPSDSSVLGHAPLRKHSAPLVNSPREVLPPSLSSRAAPVSFARPRPPPGAFPLTQKPAPSRQRECTAATCTSEKTWPAPILSLPRDVSPLSVPSCAVPVTFTRPPPSSQAFPLAQPPASSTPFNIAPFPHASTRVQSAPLVSSPRDVSTPPVQSFTAPVAFTHPPPPPHVFPLVQQPMPSAPSVPASATQAPSRNQPASLVNSPRNVSPPPASNPALPTLFERPPPLSGAFPLAQQAASSGPHDSAGIMHVPSRQQSTQPVGYSRIAPPLSAHTPAPHQAIQLTRQPACTFPHAAEPAQPTESAQADRNDATLDALAETVATLRKGLEAFLANLSKSGPRAPEPEARRVRADRCKFCRSTTHFEEECEAADDYVLAGKCKRNAFGRLTLPSGAEVPRHIQGKNLQEKFDAYHERYPGQKARPEYLATLSRARKPAPYESKDAAPLATEAAVPRQTPASLETSESARKSAPQYSKAATPPATDASHAATRGTDTTHPATPETPAQHDQPPQPRCNAHIDTTYMAILGRRTNIGRPPPAQNNRAACTPRCVHRRRSKRETPEYCAMFTVQNINPRPPHDPVQVKTSASVSPGRPIAPVPARTVPANTHAPRKNHTASPSTRVVHHAPTSSPAPTRIAAPSVGVPVSPRSVARQPSQQPIIPRQSSQWTRVSRVKVSTPPHPKASRNRPRVPRCIFRYPAQVYESAPAPRLPRHLRFPAPCNSLRRAKSTAGRHEEIAPRKVSRQCKPPDEAYKASTTPARC
jgi:hypothetical protein